ncbi:MAG: hemin uptake protein HemP [Candidatus Methylomirabilota bacterium]|nr:hemin uptake protein HemP [candidate division NC10 bacterium]PWB47578.1 MAG: hemin uptake protein HemP [candidate division NC10 bacterium]
MMKQAPSAHRTDRLAASSPPVHCRRKIESATLFQRDRELVIIHEGQEYVLRITRNGKLILTK